MRALVLVIVSLLILVDWFGSRNNGVVAAGTISRASISAAQLSEVSVNTASPKVDFDNQIKPIFQSKCMPCHFSGGVMYEKLPFDRPETIRKLNEKLFTRIKDENHRRLIREFLAE